MSSDTPQSAAPAYPDPLIDEVRALRQRLSERFGNDVDRLADHLKTIEQQSKTKVIKAPDRPGEGQFSVA